MATWVAIHVKVNVSENAQANSEWHANIKREIVADLADLNRPENAAVDVTSVV